MTVRDFICLLGQDTGEFMYCFGFWILFQKFGFFKAITEFWMSLLIIDIFTIIFMNPYEVIIPKYWVFSFAAIVLLFRFKKYLNGQ